MDDRASLQASSGPTASNSMPRLGTERCLRTRVLGRHSPVSLRSRVVEMTAELKTVKRDRGVRDDPRQAGRIQLDPRLLQQSLFAVPGPLPSHPESAPNVRKLRACHDRHSQARVQWVAIAFCEECRRDPLLPSLSLLSLYAHRRPEDASVRFVLLLVCVSRDLIPNVY